MADLEIVDRLPRLPQRPADSNKGTFGRVLIIAGSRGMSGAAVLAASASLRAGAGLVRVGVPDCILPIVAVGNPCVMTVPLPGDSEGRLSTAAIKPVHALAEASTAIALGPGLGRSADLDTLVAHHLQHSKTPLVLDADGLNAVADNYEPLKRHAGPVIITPHPGEFGRLVGLSPGEVQQRRQELAVNFARDFNLVVVLKGHGTIVTDGKQLFINSTGNPGMATAGSGDVLTGVLAALWAQGLEPFAAAQLAVHLHGVAGDLARDRVGEISLIATDLIDHLPAAFQIF